ncbi:MAG TPA: hypothetical protein PL124_07500 [Candidatus Cloacimonadota bacterium]|nr:hypothetical protein [Candidatus Cloacimonadota bacterium]HPS39242.1 hypothetical protein [Candidatus Cloacimonadota bacterium]
MPKLRDTDDIAIDLALTHKLIGNIPEANSGAGKLVQIALQKVKDLLLGLNVEIGGDASGDILTTDGTQPISNKAITESAIDALTTVVIDGVATAIGEAINLKAATTTMNAALLLKEDKIAASNRPYMAIMAKKSSGSGVIAIAPADLLVSLVGAGTTGLGVNGEGLIVQVYTVGQSEDTFLHNPVIVTTYDGDAVLLGLNISGLVNSTDYHVSIVARIIGLS